MDGETDPISPLGQGGLSTKRVSQDIDRVTPYWQQVFNNKGLNTNLNVNGHGGDQGRASKSPQRGGKRVKKVTIHKNHWYHPDAHEAMDIFFKDSETNF